jgi:hypothetical protein
MYIVLHTVSSTIASCCFWGYSLGRGISLNHWQISRYPPLYYSFVGAYKKQGKLHWARSSSYYYYSSPSSEDSSPKLLDRHRHDHIATLSTMFAMFAVNNVTTYRPPVRPPNGTRTGVVPHPSQGGNVYAPEFRDQVISIWQNGGNLRSPWSQGGAEAWDDSQGRVDHLRLCLLSA